MQLRRKFIIYNCKAVCVYNKKCIILRCLQFGFMHRYLWLTSSLRNSYQNFFIVCAHKKLEIVTKSYLRKDLTLNFSF